MKKSALLTFALLFFCGCGRSFFMPTGPSGLPAQGNGLLASDTPQGPIEWSPYVVVHSDPQAVNVYKNALSLLKSKNMIRGVRMGLSLPSTSLVQAINSLGIEVVGIVPNESLSEPNVNVEAMIDRYVLAYPSINFIQIGNEVSTINRSQGFSNMPIEVYMDLFIKIYNHIQDRYPYITLITQSTYGSGSYGSDELIKMVNLGLKPSILSYKKVIVGANVYGDTALNNYISVRDKYLSGSQGGYRIWVMETGSSDPNRHIEYVKSFYPRLASSLGAERIYWYVLWGGDGPPDNGYGLISNLYGSNPTYSPLFKALAGIE